MGVPTIFFAFSKKQPLILTKKNSRRIHFFIILGVLSHEKFIRNTNINIKTIYYHKEGILYRKRLFFKLYFIILFFFLT